MAPSENINVGEMPSQARAFDQGAWQQSKCSGKRLEAAAAVWTSINYCDTYKRTPRSSLQAV